MPFDTGGADAVAEHREHRRQLVDHDRRPARPHGGGARRSRRCSGSRSASLGVPVASLTVEQGRRLGRRQDRHLRAADRRQALQRHLHATTLNAGQPPSKPVSSYKHVGIRVPRYDIPPIVTGDDTYIQNVRVPGMLHGRIVRPRGQGAYGDGTNPVAVAVDESSIAHIPNVTDRAGRATSSASSRRRSSTPSRRRPS